MSADFLGGREPKKSVSDEDSAALQNWVIRRLTKQMRLVKNPSIATRRDAALIAALCAAPGQRNASKMAGKLPQNRGPRSASVGHVYRGTMLRYFLALLACLGESCWPALINGGSTANLFRGANQDPFSRSQRALAGQPCTSSGATERGGRAQQR